VLQLGKKEVGGKHLNWLALARGGSLAATTFKNDGNSDKWGLYRV
jgi:hypothetical protein